ncbi:MAG: helix-turn-helix transcriptional regulator [Bacteroidia bacterium]|nr:helix-turn-helix transcriptional regulator [Bacteroidia bacterium]
MNTKNIDKVAVREHLNTETSKLMVFDCTSAPLNHQMVLNSDAVHFFYCKSGEPIFQFSEHYQRPLPEGSYFTIYDQGRDLNLNLHAQCGQIVYVSLDTESIHNNLLEDRRAMVELGFKGFGVRDYSVNNISFAVDLVLDSLFDLKAPTLLKSVYYKAKIMELLSFTFDVKEDHLYEACPFLKEKDNVERIKRARNILIDNLNDPPGLSELAKQIGMNEYNLKVGFKNVYGLPAFKYLQEHRLNLAKKWLSEGQWQVAEIADRIGYKSSSHFIEAFRKKFGNTPKKFMQSKQ